MTGHRRGGPGRAVGLVIAALLGSGLLGVGPTPAVAAPTEPLATSAIGAPVMLVVDTSGSMTELDGTQTVKLDGARRALLQLIGALPPSTQLGMRTYPGSGGDCDPGQLDITVGLIKADEASAEVRALTADGGTPTAEALRAAADDLRFAGYSSATIVLVSDGQSTCDPPCDVAADLRTEGFDIVVNTVGFQIDSAGAEELQCIADTTGGSYHDARDSAALAAELAATQVPSLDVDLAYTPQYSLADAAQLDITATVANESDVLAEDIRASIVFDVDASAGAPTVLQPLRVLGNAAGGQRLRVSWQVYPGLVGDDDIGAELSFTVYVSTRYGAPVVQQGTVTISATTLADAAPWLRDVDEVVVLGDSYSSGEGGGAYTDDAEGTGGCHRSPNTYAAALYRGSGTEVVNLACSGAVTNDYISRQSGRTVDPQRDQLAGYGDYDLVMLTMGGNDIHFPDIVRNCATGSDCSGGFRCAIPVVTIFQCPSAIRSAPTFWQGQLDDLQVHLTRWYEQVLADTGGVPVIVLPYVNPIPNGTTVTAGCSGTSLFGIDFSPRELRMVQWLQTALNEHIRRAVETVGDDRLLFAADVAGALQPSHTLCSQDRWMVGISDRGLKPTSQELVHPTAEGYAAIARALTRWSHGEDPPARTGTGGWFAASLEGVVDGVLHSATELLQGRSTIDLQNGSDPTAVTGGGILSVRSGGYGPGERVLVTVRSTSQALGIAVADDDGRIDAEVTIPDSLPPGEHTVLAQGFTEDGNYLVTGAGLDVGRRSPWGGLAAAGLGSLLTLGGGWMLRTARRAER